MSFPGQHDPRFAPPPDAPAPSGNPESVGLPLPGGTPATSTAGPGHPEAPGYPGAPGYGGYPVAPAQPAFPSYVGAPYPAPPARRSTGVTVAIVVGAVLGGLVVLSVLAAIAVPVYENQQAQALARRTTVTMPATLEGQPRMTGTADQNVQAEVAQLPAVWGTPQAAAYGTGTQVQSWVIAGVHPLKPSDQSSFLRGFDKGVTSVGAAATTATDPGPLGGQLRCTAALDGRSTTCAFADGGAFGVITVLALGDDAHALALRIRADVRHRS